MIGKSSSAKDMVAAIDLGSSHCLTLIAHRDRDNQLKIIGLGNVPSKGVKHATIIDLDQATDTIERSLAMAEQMCGNNVDSVYVNVSGKHISSSNSSGVVVVAGNEIDETDVDRAIDSARTVSLDANREVLNLMPRFFSVDGQDGIRDPRGMVGVRLEVDIHQITANSSALHNLEKAITNIGLDREGLVFSGYAAAEVVLSDVEKDAGAICIDIGSDTTDYCVYVDGAIQCSGVIPIGGRYVTQDLNSYTRVGLENAEKIKLALGQDLKNIPPRRPDEPRSEYSSRVKAADLLNLTEYEPTIKPATLSRSAVTRAVIAPRLKEIFDLVAVELKKQKIADKLSAGAVVVGGAAKTVGLVDVARMALGMQVRLGVPQGIEGVIKHLDDPVYATAIGLLHYADKEQQVESSEPGKPTAKASGFDNFFTKLGDAVKKIMP